MEDAYHVRLSNSNFLRNRVLLQAHASSHFTELADVSSFHDRPLQAKKRFN